MSTSSEQKPVRFPKLWGLRLLVTLALVLALAACAGSGFLLYQFWLQHTHKPAQQQASALDHSMVDALQQQWHHAHQQLQQSLAALKTQQAVLSKERLPRATLQTLNLLAVKAAITVAQTLLAARQSPQLISQAVDQAINNLPVMGGHSEVLRQRLARINAQLLALPALQTHQVLAQLDHYYDELAQLQFVQPVSQPVEHTQQHWDWRHPKQAAQQAWHWVKSVVVIDKGTAIGQRLLGQATRLNALALLNLKWNEVRWYVLTHSPQYPDALRALIEQIQQTTQPNDAQQKLISQLKAMSSEVVGMPTDQLNAISQSLQQANDLVDHLRAA